MIFILNLHFNDDTHCGYRYTRASLLCENFAAAVHHYNDKNIDVIIRLWIINDQNEQRLLLETNQNYYDNSIQHNF